MARTSVLRSKTLAEGEFTSPEHFNFLPESKKEVTTYVVTSFFGAGDEARTRYLHLGKVALYQMSYGRILETRLGFLDWCLRSESNQ